MKGESSGARRRAKQFGRQDGTIALTMGAVALGTVLYRIAGPLLDKNVEPTAQTFVEPFVWIAPIAALIYIARRQTIKARVRAGLCTKCEREISREEFETACPACGRRNGRMVKWWLVGEGEWAAGKRE